MVRKGSGYKTKGVCDEVWCVCCLVWYVVLCVGVIDVNVLSLTSNAEVACFIAQSVADPGGFHGFHGTPLSQETTADYVAR